MSVTGTKNLQYCQRLPDEQEQRGRHLQLLTRGQVNLRQNLQTTLGDKSDTRDVLALLLELNVDQ